MAKVTEITVWTRGVVMDKEARDVANAFAQAAKAEGKFIQAFDNYEDLPDRVLVTTRKYARISDEEIEMKYLYTNSHPDVVVIVEPTIVKQGGLAVVTQACRKDTLSRDAWPGGPGSSIRRNRNGNRHSGGCRADAGLFRHRISEDFQSLAGNCRRHCRRCSGNAGWGTRTSADSGETLSTRRIRDPV